MLDVVFPGHIGHQSSVVSDTDQFISLWTSLQVDSQPMLQSRETNNTLREVELRIGNLYISMCTNPCFKRTLSNE